MSSARFKLSAPKYRKLLEEVSERDWFCCVICGEPHQTPHHIDKRSSGGGDYIENIISLCVFPNDCHGKVERGEIEIPGTELERVGYYSKNQKRL
ncbi:MAG: HNH endonuclease [Candidatus Sabulitectum sp.]|nr:HNH endonuclease [Candidatus Sabulitectum sp.]